MDWGYIILRINFKTATMTNLSINAQANNPEHKIRRGRGNEGSPTAKTGTYQLGRKL